MKKDNVLRDFIFSFIEVRKANMNMSEETYHSLYQKACVVYKYFISDENNVRMLSLSEKMLALDIHDEMLTAGKEDLYVRYSDCLWMPCYGTELITHQDIKECISLGLEFYSYTIDDDFEYECYWDSHDPFYEWVNKGKNKQFYWINRS